MIQHLKQFDPNAIVLLYDHHRSWVQGEDVSMRERTSPLAEGKPEEKQKLLFIRPEEKITERKGDNAGNFK